MTQKCNICGKFAKIVDVAIPWGSYCDIEPPDEIWFCERCANEQYKYYLSIGYPPSYWRKPEFAYIAAKELGFIEVGHKGCAWSFWQKKDTPLTDGDIIWWDGTGVNIIYCKNSMDNADEIFVKIINHQDFIPAPSGEMCLDCDSPAIGIIFFRPIDSCPPPYYLCKEHLIEEFGEYIE